MQITEKFPFTNLYKYITFAIAIGIILRPLSFSGVGDFLIYLKGSRELVSGIDLYEIDRAPFGSRYFNGPLLAILLFPFTYLDSGVALFLFRLMNIIAISLAFRKYVGSKMREFPEAYLLLFLLFPVRMNTNLAQGSGIALLLYLWTCSLLFNRNSKKRTSTNQILASFAFVLASNYKPQLGLLLFIFAILMKKKFFFIGVFTQILSLEIFVRLFDWKFSYFNWLNLLIERSTRIQNGGSEALFGPLALMGHLFSFNPTYFVAIILLVLMCFFVWASKRCRIINRREIDMKFGQLSLVLAPLTVSYSPLQDSIAVVLFLFLTVNRKLQRKINVIEVIALVLLLLPTDKSLLNFLLLVIVGVSLIHPRRVDFLILLPVLFLVIVFSEKYWYSHMIYDLAGLGVLMLAINSVAKSIKIVDYPNIEKP